MGEFTFVIEKPCPVCGMTTRVVKTKSRLQAEKTDEDFCVHYKGFNPYFYRVWFCEHCGFAADEKRFLATMPARSKKKIQDFLSKRHLGMEFTEVRGVPEAVASYKLAIYYEELTEGAFNTRAGLYLSLAWVYRDTEEREKEMEALEHAAELYDQSLAKERYPIGNMTDNMCIYLVGAIYFRMGDMDKATQYLSRIIGDQKARDMDATLYKKARDLWQDVREKKGEKEEKGAPKK